MFDRKEHSSEQPKEDLLPSFDDVKTATDDNSKKNTVQSKTKTPDTSKKKEHKSLKELTHKKSDVPSPSTEDDVKVVAEKTEKTEKTQKSEKNEALEKGEKKKSKKAGKSDKLVKEGVVANERNEHAKIIFIVSMILLTPLALVIALAVVILFIVALLLTLLIGGIMGIALTGIVGAGVVLSFVGIAYGTINLLTAEGFALAAGQYELGLGLAIAGITIIISALLYSGMTDLVPFVVKKLGQFFKFLAKQIKRLVKWIYKYSTQL